MAHHHEHHHEHHHCESCGCDHHHDEGNGRHGLYLIIAAALLLGVAVLVEHTTRLATWQLFLVYLVPYLVVGHGTLREAAEGLAHGHVFNEHFLMTVATAGAFAIGFLPGVEHEFVEAVAVMLFFAVGELLEGYAEGKSRDSIAHLMDLRPDTATVVRDGREVVVTPDAVAVGETLVVKPGERVPLDGVVLTGVTALNTAALTGETLPHDIAPGDEIVSGCVNLRGVVTMRVTRPYGESTVARIIELVEHAGERKSRGEAFITRFARYYTPIVVMAAVALVAVPVVLGGALATWLYRALMFLVVSCPCALVISVPLTYFSGLGGASRRGILVKGANYLDVLARVRTVVFDKTGTLTHGQFAVTAVHPSNCDEHQLLHLAAHVEHFTTHPIGAALRDAFPDEATDGCRVDEVEEIAGKGITAVVGGKRVSVGNTSLMEAVGATWSDCPHDGTIIHVAIDGAYAGHIVINDVIKESSAGAIDALRHAGVTRTVMLTGDRDQVASTVAARLSLDEYHAELLPPDKVERVEQLLAQRGHNEALAFVGDGINDAPVLARADVGIAMGAMGSDAAIEAADVVLMDDNPAKVALSIKVARRTRAIARQNVVMAIGIKLVVLALAAAGLATMWLAVFADVGVTLLAVVNATRAMRAKAINN